MKAIPKDKKIAEYTLISAPIDETNVQSDTSYGEYSTMRSA